MKKFLVSAIILGTLLVASWIDFIPIRCEGCQGLLFRTDIASMIFGGHGEVYHQRCLKAWTNSQLGYRPSFGLLPLGVCEKPEPTAADPAT